MSQSEVHLEFGSADLREVQHWLVATDRLVSALAQHPSVTRFRLEGPEERPAALTGCGALVNTSFNVRDEPVVCTPGDAYRCFMATEMDVLVIGNLVLYKEEQ